MDNISFHKSKKIRALLEEKNIEPIYIVPYFPQLNPTEQFFNTVKQAVKKRQPRSGEGLIDVLAEIKTELQEANTAKYFQDCLDFKIE